DVVEVGVTVKLELDAARAAGVLGAGADERRVDRAALERHASRQLVNELRLSTGQGQRSARADVGDGHVVGRGTGRVHDLDAVVLHDGELGQVGRLDEQAVAG